MVTHLPIILCIKIGHKIWVKPEFCTFLVAILSFVIQMDSNQGQSRDTVSKAFWEIHFMSLHFNLSHSSKVNSSKKVPYGSPKCFEIVGLRVKLSLWKSLI